MQFYRYESVQYATLDSDDNYATSFLPNIQLELKTFNLWKETPKGYWIGYGQPNSLNSGGRWIPKESKKRYAYPTKKEALYNFIKRTEKRINILNNQKSTAQIGLNLAKKEYDNENL